MRAQVLWKTGRGNTTVLRGMIFSVSELRVRDASTYHIIRRRTILTRGSNKIGAWVDRLLTDPLMSSDRLCGRIDARMQ
jgi:hypothetical protein